MLFLSFFPVFRCKNRCKTSRSGVLHRVLHR
nr:MAG TPA: hypothetical protein [Caudoviricetes sp.]